MHEVTRRVRTMYERHPYPHKEPGLVSNLHPELMISYVERAPGPRVKTMLDAGCGTGSSCLGTAQSNTNYHVTAIDMNRTALEQVRTEAAAMGLKNLRVLECDLNTLEGLPVPPGGFDFILASGSLPCVADPALVLRNLARVLARDGVMRIMVYNRWGRQGIYRFVEAMNVLHKEREAIPERLVLARRLLEALRDGPVNQAPWQDPHKVDDHEFVDRYLNVHDLSYNIPEFLALLQATGWRFLRWYEPRHWTLRSVLADEDLCEELSGCSESDLWAFIELVAHRPQLDAIIIGPQGRPRPPFDPDSGELLALNPQLVLHQLSVPGREGLSPVSTALALRQRPAGPASAAQLEVLTWLSSARAATFRELVEGLGGRVSATELLTMLDQEFLYRYPDLPGEAAPTLPAVGVGMPERRARRR